MALYTLQAQHELHEPLRLVVPINKLGAGVIRSCVDLRLALNVRRRLRLPLLLLDSACNDGRVQSDPASGCSGTRSLRRVRAWHWQRAFVGACAEITPRAA